MNKINLLILVSIVTLLGACKKAIKQPIESANNIKAETALVTNALCTAHVTTLWANQNINAGTVSVENDLFNTFITYTTTNGYLLSKTHLYVGSLSGLPLNSSGNAIPNYFPYITTHSNITTYTYTIPNTIFDESGCSIIAARASLKKLNNGCGGYSSYSNYTGWAEGVQINPGCSWAMRFDYCLCYGSDGL